MAVNGFGQAAEHAAAVVGDLRRLAVHHVRRAHDVGRRRSGRCTGARSTRRAPGRRPRRRRGWRRSTRRRRRARRGSPGPGDTSTASGSSALQLVERDRVVAVHDRLRAELTEVLHEVVDERVVVVDDEHPHVGHATGAGDRATATGGDWLRSPAVAPTKKAPSRPPTRRPTQGLALHAARAQEGEAEPPVGAGDDVHLPGARRGRDRAATTSSCCPAAR